MMEKTLGQIACEAVSGHDGWAACADVPGLQAMWEAAGQAVAAVERERCAKIADTMRIEGACPDTEESAQNWCARYIAELIREG